MFDTGFISLAAPRAEVFLILDVEQVGAILVEGSFDAVHAGVPGQFFLTVHVLFHVYHVGQPSFLSDFFFFLWCPSFPREVNLGVFVRDDWDIWRYVLSGFIVVPGGGQVEVVGYGVLHVGADGVQDVAAVGAVVDVLRPHGAEPRECDDEPLVQHGSGKRQR